VISSVPYANNMTGRTTHTILMTVASLIPTVHLSKGMGVQEVHKRIEREHEGANFAQIVCKEVKKVLMTQKVTAIQTTVREVMGRIEQGN